MFESVAYSALLSNAEKMLLRAVYFNNMQKKSTVSLVSLFLCVCVSLFTVTRSTPAPILSTAMESASGPAVKHCVRTWDSSSSKLATNQKRDIT